MQLRIFKKKLCVWKNPRTWTCKRGKYLEITIHDSVITCDEIKDATKTNPAKTIPRKTVLIYFNKLLSYKTSIETKKSITISR